MIKNGYDDLLCVGRGYEKMPTRKLALHVDPARQGVTTRGGEEEFSTKANVKHLVGLQGGLEIMPPKSDC
jgi:hypothetical protein